MGAKPAVLVILQGPDHYITPNWYPSKWRHGRVVLLGITLLSTFAGRPGSSKVNWN
ncbi:MAG: FMN-binding negative transcriptional regulator, partial [Bryobacteraceae bacterium]